MGEGTLQNPLCFALTPLVCCSLKPKETSLLTSRQCIHISDNSAIINFSQTCSSLHNSLGITRLMVPLKKEKLPELLQCKKWFNFRWASEKKICLESLLSWSLPKSQYSQTDADLLTHCMWRWFWFSVCQRWFTKPVVTRTSNKD